MTKSRKGIILAGGNGSRLLPITKAVSKQLLPVYDKPMIFYPLSTLMLSGINDILIITKPEDQADFKDLLGDGSVWNISIQYAVQEKPEGIAQAFVLAEDFIDRSPVALILGDNLFHGEGLGSLFRAANRNSRYATVFAYKVQDPKRYGVVSFSKRYKAVDIQEKPQEPLSNYAVTGLYFYDASVVRRAKKLTLSERGEYEITDINRSYLKDNKLSVEILSAGSAWLDTGTPDSLHDAASYIRTLQNRQGIRIGCPFHAAMTMGWL